MNQETTVPYHALGALYDLDALNDLQSLTRLVTLGLAAERGDASGGNPPEELTAVVERARQHRLEGFLLRHKKALSLNDEMVSRLESTALMRAQQGLSQWGATIALSRMLHSHQLDHLIFKGRALTLQTEAEADGRGGGDVDLLVSPRDVARAHTLLLSEGFSPVYAVEPRTSWGWAFVAFRNREMPYRSAHVEVDLHWRISPERDLLPSTDILLSRKVVVGREGQVIPTLAPADALAACAFHFYHDFASALRRLIDFVRLSRLVSPDAVSALPIPSRQLITDVAALCQELFGEHSIDSGFTVGFRPKNRAYLAELLWSGKAGFDHQGRSDNPLRRAVMNFQHVSRYTSVAALVCRLMARGIVWFPPATPGERGWSIPRAIRHQLWRIVRGQFDSHV